MVINHLFFYRARGPTLFNPFYGQRLEISLHERKTKLVFLFGFETEYSTQLILYCLI